MVRRADAHHEKAAVLTEGYFCGDGLVGYIFDNGSIRSTGTVTVEWVGFTEDGIPVFEQVDRISDAVDWDRVDGRTKAILVRLWVKR